MPMTKKERAEVDAIIERAETIEAQVRQPYLVTPIDTSSLLYNEPLRTAWTYNHYNRRVTHGCFTLSRHSPDDLAKTRSQGCGGPWFDTELEAWMAMRNAIAAESFQRLRDLDAMISLIGSMGAVL